MCDPVRALDGNIDGLAACTTIGGRIKKKQNRMAGLMKRQKLYLKGRKAAGDQSNYDTDDSTVSSEFSERTSSSVVIDLTENEAKPTDDNR